MISIPMCGGTQSHHFPSFFESKTHENETIKPSSPPLTYLSFLNYSPSSLSRYVLSVFQIHYEYTYKVRLNPHPF